MFICAQVWKSQFIKVVRHRTGAFFDNQWYFLIVNLHQWSIVKISMNFFTFFSWNLSSQNPLLVSASEKFLLKTHCCKVMRRKNFPHNLMRQSFSLRYRFMMKWNCCVGDHNAIKLSITIFFPSRLPRLVCIRQSKVANGKIDTKSW